MRPRLGEQKAGDLTRPGLVGWEEQSEKAARAPSGLLASGTGEQAFEPMGQLSAQPKAGGECLDTGGMGNVGPKKVGKREVSPEIGGDSQGAAEWGLTRQPTNRKPLPMGLKVAVTFQVQIDIKASTAVCEQVAAGQASCAAGQR